jgi:hypothetical protein
MILMVIQIHTRKLFHTPRFSQFKNACIGVIFGKEQINGIWNEILLLSMSRLNLFNLRAIMRVKELNFLEIRHRKRLIV